MTVFFIFYSMIFFLYSMRYFFKTQMEENRTFQKVTLEKHEEEVIAEFHNIILEARVKRIKKKFFAIFMLYSTVPVISIVFYSFFGLEAAVVSLILSIWIYSSIVVFYLFNMRKIDSRIDKVFEKKNSKTISQKTNI